MHANEGDGMNKKRGAGLKALLRSWRETNKGLFFKRMLVWYTTSTILVYLFFEILTSMSVQNNYQEQIAQLNEKSIAQSVNTCTNMLRNLYNYYYLNVLDSAEFTELLLKDDYSANLSIQFSRLNSALVNYSDLVESCYVINLKGGFVCSTLDTYRNLEEFPDQDILGQLELLQDIHREYMFIPRKTTYTVRGNSYTRKYISLIFKKYKEGYFVINLDYDLFANMVNYRNYDNASRGLLVNELGMVMSDSSESLFGENVSGEPFMEKLDGIQDGNGTFQVSLPEGRKKVYYYKNQLFGISYLILADEVFLGENTLLLRILLYAVIAMAVNLGLIVLGTCLLYGPIGRLQQLLQTWDQSTDSGPDEFQEMERVFHGMRGITREYSITKRKRILKNLLEDSNSGVKASDDVYKKLKADLDNTSFVCVNLYPNLEENTDKEDKGLMLFSMENILGELLEPEVHMECIDCGTYLVCVINLDMTYMQSTEESSRNPVQNPNITPLVKTLRGMQERMGEFFHVDVSCSVGTVVNALDDISESYEAALTAAFFQMTREKAAMLLYNELISDQSEVQEFPTEQSKDILDGIKTGDRGKIRSGISEFFDCIRNYHYYQAIKSLQLLELEIIRLEMRFGIYHDEFKDYMTESAFGKRLYRLQEGLLARSLSAADRYREKRENNPNMRQIVDHVKVLVEENLTQKDLNVTFIAQKLYLSTNYVRNIFREVAGEPLSSYIISKRLAKICELLQETDWSGQQIADYMGFASKSYFYTFFKNYMGVTPSQYRKNGAGESIPVPDVEEDE